MTAPMFFRAVVVTIQFATLAANAWCFRLTTRGWQRQHAHVFVRMRRVNVALMAWTVVWIIAGLVAMIAGR